MDRRASPRTLAALALCLAAASCRPAGEPGAGSGEPAAPPSEQALRQLNLGVRRLEQFRYADAAAHFEQAIAAHPGWLAAQVDLAIAHLNDVLTEGHAERAVAAADAALALGPDDPRAAYVKAYALSEQLRRHEEALPLLRAVTAAAPDDPHAAYQLGRTAQEVAEGTDDPRRRAGLQEEAERAYRLALELEPTLSEANYKLARLLVEADDDARRDEGLALLQRHQELVRGRPPVQQNYLRRGALALAYPFRPVPGPPPEPGLVSFSVGRELSLPPFRGVEARPGLSPGRYAQGVSVLDLDGDGRLDLVGPQRDVAQPAVLAWRGRGERQFAHPLAFGLQGSACASAAPGDFERDGDLDLLVTCNSGNVLLVNQGDGTLADATTGTDAADPAAAGLAATPVDVDHDGDLDVHVVGPVGDGLVLPSRLLRNDGLGSFAPAETELGLDLPLAAADRLWSDLDGDNAVDMLGVGPGGLVIALNHRDGPFVAHPLGDHVPSLRGVAAATVRLALLDVDRDADLDVVVVARLDGRSTLVVLGNRSRPGALAFELLAGVAAPEGTGALAVADFDADGEPEVLAFGAGEAGSGAEGETIAAPATEVELSGGGRLVVRSLGASTLDARRVAVADLDADGRPDLVGLRREGGAPVVLWNAASGASGSTAVSIVPVGRKERSNPQGLGAKLTVHAGSLRRYHEVRAGQGALENVVAPAGFGLGNRPAADGVSVLWPSGIRQAEVDLAAGETHRVVELDRQPSSCPMLYAWDGLAWRFQSDCFDTAPLGLWVAPGTHVVGDPDEEYRLRPGAVRLQDGVANLLVAEFLNETLLADRVALEVVALAPGRQLIVDEGVRLASPPPETARWTVGGASAPRDARLGGRSVIDAVRDEDREVAGWQRATPWLGLAEPFALELDLADAAGLLVLTGSLNFSNSTNLFAAHQAGVGPRPPRLEVRTGAGWRELTPDVGAPAGFHKDVAIDLRSFGLAGPVTLRVVTSLQVSWDRAAVYRDARPVLPDDVRAAPLLRAEKAWLGIPREERGPQNRWRSFPLDGLTGASDWVVQDGPWTPDGDARALLAEADDEVAFVRPGEAVELGFLVGPPPENGARALVLVTRGWVKDADPHTALSSSVLPLPRPGAALYP